MDNSISTMRPELIKEWSEKNLPLTPDEVSYGSNKLYWWIGSCGHEWQTSAKARSHGEKCPICSNARIIPGINDLPTLCPGLCREWSEKNAPLEPTMLSVGSNQKVIWRCSEGHEWTASVKSRTVNKTGCPYCSHNAVLSGYNDLATLFPEVAKEWSDKNLPLRPSQVTAYANKKVWWRCKHGHEWDALISTRSYGSKCPYCSGIKTLKGFNDLETLCPGLAKEWSDKNGTFHPDMVNTKSVKNVWWQCRECGYEWKAVVKKRVRGAKCPVCIDREVLPGYNDFATTDPDLIREWDYEKNKPLLPQNLSRNSMHPVWWKCKYGHSWKDKITNRSLAGGNCRICEAEFTSALPQLLILLYAGRNKLAVKLNDEKTIGIRIDAYIPELNLCFVVCEKETKEERSIRAIAKYVCKMQGGSLVQLPAMCDPEALCVSVKKAFQSKHIFLSSDNEKDVELVREQFAKLRMSYYAVQ